MSRSLRIACAALTAASLAPGPAAAEADRFGLGNGTWDGSAVSGVINRVAPITATVAAGATTVTIGAAVGATANFAAGDLVMLWQPTGLPTFPGWSASPVTLQNTPVGLWEFAVLAADPSGGTLTLTAPTVNAYAADRSQVVRVPQYGPVTITGAVSATPWDGAKGGLVVFLADGDVTISGTISASGAGFRGGPETDQGADNGCTADFGAVSSGYAPKGEGIYWEYYRANGAGADEDNGRGAPANAGGGGDCHNSGGGGGGHAARGGNGGPTYDGTRDYGGVGGGALVWVSGPGRLTFGGGGGAGETNDSNGGSGGAGGGVVFFRARSLVGGGTISADGAAGGAGSNDGAGGGGAGGKIVVRLTGTATCTKLSARGGNGGNNTAGHGTGGGGSGGLVYLQAATGGACPTDYGAGANGTGGNVSTAVAGNGSLPGPFPGNYCGNDTHCAANAHCLTPTGYCVECARDGHCPVSQPICDASSHTCRPCTPAGSEADCAPLVCDVAGSFPGQCVECLGEAQCQSTNEHCDLLTEVCFPCVVNSNCGNPTPACLAHACVKCTANDHCTEGGRRLCRAGGSLDGWCTECSSSDLTRCPEARPACSASTGACVACTTDHAVASDAPCPTASRPACQPSLGCTECSGSNPSACTTDKPACLSDSTCGCDDDGDCRQSVPTRLCDAASRTCQDGCRGSDNRCPADQICTSVGAEAGVCIPLPPDAGAPGPDAAAPGPDAAQPGPDAAAPGPDAAQPGADAALPGPDAALPGHDAAQPGPDADTPGPDATVAADAAAEPDASGPGADAAEPPDASEPRLDASIARVDASIAKPDASPGPPPSYDLGGCGCGSVGAPGAAWLGLALALQPLRRRRR